MLSRERMLVMFNRAYKHFMSDPYMEKFSVSYKLNDVEIFSREFSKDGSIKFDRIYSDIAKERKYVNYFSYLFD